MQCQLLLKFYFKINFSEKVKLLLVKQFNENYLLKQQFLYFFPLPQGHGELRPTLIALF